MKKKIAIIGSGISGLTCAHLLHKKYDITLYEANDYVGGHTATKQYEVQGKQYAIDTGFIVFNDWTYPNFIKLMKRVGIESQATEMSFSVKNPKQNLEYNGNNLNSLFAQRRNLLRPNFWRMVKDILRFNKECKALFNSARSHSQAITLGEFLIQSKYSDMFANNYILPMTAAIWSASLSQVKSFPLQFFLQFFNNHGLLNVTDRPQWATIVGGSSQYIPALTKGFADNILLNSAVTRVTSEGDGYRIETINGDTGLYDEVIFACHSDQALSMLAEPSAAHQSILGDIRYASNEVVVHTDTSILPKRPLAWASWNYLLQGSKGEMDAPTSLTYNMNILQRINAPVTFCVTLNNSALLDNKKVLGRYQYSHPQFSQAMVDAQSRRMEICGVNQLHFCGAYWHNGFHEDGVKSALEVCARFGVSLDD